MPTITEDHFHATLRRHLKYLDPETAFDPDMELKLLGLDSMASLNLLFDIEDTFNVSLPDENLNDQTFATGRSLREAVEKAAATA